MGIILEAKNKVELSPKELSSILRQGAILRLPFLEGRLMQARDNIRNLERKYNTTLNQLKAKGLPNDAGYEMHEDFIEWEYWDDVSKETGENVEHIKKLLKKVEEESIVY